MSWSRWSDQRTFDFVVCYVRYKQNLTNFIFHIFGVLGFWGLLILLIALPRLDPPG